MVKKNKMVEVCVEVKRETEKAYLVSDGSLEEWVPKSQIGTMDVNVNSDTVNMELPEWLAKAKGVV